MKFHSKSVKFQSKIVFLIFYITETAKYQHQLLDQVHPQQPLVIVYPQRHHHRQMFVQVRHIHEFQPLQCVHQPKHQSDQHLEIE